MRVLDNLKEINRARRELRKDLIDRINKRDYNYVKQVLVSEIHCGNYRFVETIVRGAKGMQKEDLKELLDALKNNSKPKFYQFYKSLCYVSLEQTLELS